MAYHLSAASGAILLGTGSYAYLKTGSVMSLVGSGGISILFGSAAYLNKSSVDNQFIGHTLGAIAGLACLTIGLRRFSNANKKYGPVALITIGALNVPYHLYKAYQWY